MELSKRKEYVSARELSEKVSVPYQFTRRILQKLSKANIISTKEGLNGGVKLSKNPENISIRELIEIFQGKIQLIDCIFSDKICQSSATCSFKYEINKVEHSVRKDLENLTISTLIK